MESRRMMFWKKDKKASMSATDVSLEANSFEEKDVGLFSLFGPFLKNYASSMSKTKNPSKLPYPTCFYLPQSTLMHMVHLQMSHSDLLINASMQPTPEDRFLAVLKYTISTWALTKFPYKPIISLLGETAHYSTSYSGSGIPDPSDKTYVIAENLRKDPPESCFHINNPKHGVFYEGTLDMSPKFKQAHVHVQFFGQNKITLADPQGAFREEFRSNIPDLMIRVLRMHTELAGEVNLTSTTGFSAKIIFKEKGLFGKAKNEIAGIISYNGVDIYNIDGSWDEVVCLTDRRTQARLELINRATIATNPLDAPPEDQQPITACTRIWNDMLAALLRRDFDTAAALKAQIMQDETRIIADMQQNNAQYVPRYFQKNALGEYELKDTTLATDYNAALAVKGAPVPIVSAPLAAPLPAGI